MRVRVKYFALLREVAATSEEVVEGNFQTPAELFLHLNKKYDFPIHVENLKVAINLDYSSFLSSLKDGDEVVFIPPVAGG